MAKNDSDLFDRLRQAGLRKQVAKTLSEIGEGASKRAVRAARSAVSELRSVAERHAEGERDRQDRGPHDHSPLAGNHPARLAIAPRRRQHGRRCPAASHPAQARRSTKAQDRRCT